MGTMVVFSFVLDAELCKKLHAEFSITSSISIFNFIQNYIHNWTYILTQPLTEVRPKSQASCYAHQSHMMGARERWRNVTRIFLVMDTDLHAMLCTIHNINVTTIVSRHTRWLLNFHVTCIQLFYDFSSCRYYEDKSIEACEHKSLILRIGGGHLASVPENMYIELKCSN